MKTLRNEEIRQVVRDTYGGIAKGKEGPMWFPPEKRNPG